PFRSITASSRATTRNSAPFLSRKNRFLVWPPGIWPRKARDCSTVNSGGWVAVEWAIPRRSRNANRSEGEAGIAGRKKQRERPALYHLRKKCLTVCRHARSGLVLQIRAPFGIGTGRQRPPYPLRMRV